MNFLKKVLKITMFVTFSFGQFALPSFQAVSNGDNVGPRITITASDGSNTVLSGSTTNDNTLTLTFTCNENTTNFAIGDVILSGGSLSSFSGSGTTYSASLSPNSERSVRVSIPAGSFTDGRSNLAFGSIPFLWTYDSSAPFFTSYPVLASDNTTVTIKFNELTYNTSNGSGALEVGDFSFTLTVPLGGTPATLNSPTPTSISKAAPSFTTTVLPYSMDGPVSVTVFDLDLDNDIDILVPLNPGSKLLWYTNNGSQSFSENIIDNSVNNPREIWPVDLDLDGDIDLVVPIEGGDELAWYENDGSQGFTKRSIDTGNNGRAVAVADIDGDNDLDITFTTYSSYTFSWYENDGLQNFTKNSINSFNVRDPVIIDLDEDGDIDFVSEIDDGSDKIVWYENDGSQSFTQNTIDEIDGGHLDVVDLDEDGDYDLVFAEYYNHLLLWYENDGSENFTKRTIDDSGVTNVWDVEAGDIDGDGDIDIVALTSTNNSIADDKIIWYANNGSELFTEYTIDTDLNHPYRLKLKDIDGDVDLDIVAGSREGDQVIWYENVDGGYVLGLSLSGTAAGSEALTVNPLSSSVYDFGGNSASNSQSYNTLNLNDKTGPTMTITATNSSSSSVSDGSTTNDNPLTITFTSSESTTNFAVADVTVSGGSLTSFSGSGTIYTATFTPSSDGATTIDVAGSTFTDASSNNNSAASQFNWTYDGTVPTITGNSLAADNSTISVTFSEAVYNTSSGSGSLETTDLTLSSSGGNASLSSSTPSSISASGNTYTLGISLSGTANGSETLIVNPISNSIYDAAGNAASGSQSNNSVSLNAVVSNYVLDLNGSNEAAYVGDNSDFETTDWSIQVWVDPNSLPSSGNEEWFVNKNRVYRIGLSNSSGTTKIIGDHRSGGSYETIEGTTLSDASGGWYHVIFTFNDSADDLKLYVNGSLVGYKLNYSGSTVNQNSEFSIGRRHDTSSGYFDGKIDEVAYWNTELSANAISALYNSGNTLSASTNSGNYTSSGNLVLYYQFQENLNDSEGSFNLTGRNISSSDYTAETID